MLDNFHKDAVSYAREHFINLSGLSMLDQQLSTYKRQLKEIPATVAGIIRDIQRDANRSFEPVIEQDMQPAYTQCTNESGESWTFCGCRKESNEAIPGVGSYMRMKGHIHDHVDQARHSMFKHAADTVRDQLKSMCDTIFHELSRLVLYGIFQNLSIDYLAVLGVPSADQMSAITRGERVLRGELSLVLARDGDAVFKNCLPGMEGRASQEKENSDLPKGHYRGNTSGTEHAEGQSDSAPRPRGASVYLGLSDETLRDVDAEAS
jgi:hypothetical protein